LPFGDSLRNFRIPFRLDLRLALAIGILGLIPDTKEVLALLGDMNYKGNKLFKENGSKLRTVLTTFPDLSMTATVSPNGGIFD